jgi:hypothetical protein
MTDKAAPKRPDSCPRCGSENPNIYRTQRADGQWIYWESGKRTSQYSCSDLWHDTAAKTTPIHFKSGCCIGEKCSVCSEQAMHKVGEEKFPDDLRHWRHNLTAYVCCKHFKEIMGRCEPLLMPNFSEPAPLTAEENQDAGIHGRNSGGDVLGISSLGNSDGSGINRRMGTGEVPAAPSEHSVEIEENQDDGRAVQGNQKYIDDNRVPAGRDCGTPNRSDSEVAPPLTEASQPEPMCAECGKPANKHYCYFGSSSPKTFQPVPTDSHAQGTTPVWAAASEIAKLQEMGIERGLELRKHKIAEIISRHFQPSAPSVSETPQKEKCND